VAQKQEEGMSQLNRVYMVVGELGHDYGQYCAKAPATANFNRMVLYSPERHWRVLEITVCPDNMGATVTVYKDSHDIPK